MEDVNPFQIIETEWREQYDREWGLGIVLSVDQGDGRVWVGKIAKDADGYFLTNQLMTRNKSQMRETKKQVAVISLELAGAVVKPEQEGKWE